MSESLDSSLIFVKYTDEEGNTEFITVKSFFEMIEKIHEAPYNDAVYDKSLIILNEVISQASKDPEVNQHPDAVAMLEKLKQIREYYLIRIPQTDTIEQFLKADSAFMVTPLPGGIEFLTRINYDAKGGTITREFENGKYKVTFTGRAGIDEQKISELIRIDFADNNFYKESKNFNTWTSIPISLTMDYLGKKCTPANKRQFRKRLRTMLNDICTQNISVKDAKGNYKAANFGTGEIEIDPKNDKFKFRISDTFAQYMNGKSQGQSYNKALRLGSTKNPLPFYLCRKLLNTYFRDGNESQGTNVILSVKKLLEYCSDMIQTYEEVQKYDPGHWVRVIRQPLERALNEIQEGGIFKWDYCKSGLAPVTTQEKRTRDYYKWEKLYITFQLIPDKPDQTERLKRKAERIEEAKRQHEIKEAEKIVKAEKIRKQTFKKLKKKGDFRESVTNEPETCDKRTRSKVREPA